MQSQASLRSMLTPRTGIRGTEGPGREATMVELVAWAAVMAAVVATEEAVSAERVVV